MSQPALEIHAKPPPSRQQNRPLRWKFFAAIARISHVKNGDENLSEPYLGIGSTSVAFSFSETSPALPLIRYLIVNCLTTPGAGSPPKLSL